MFLFPFWEQCRLCESPQELEPALSILRFSIFFLDIQPWQLGAAARHVRTTARLAALPGGLAASHHWTSAGHQLRVRSGVTSRPVQRWQSYALAQKT